MDETTQQDFFCTQCSLQFGKKYVFDVHLSLVHGKKVVIINEDSKISFGESHEEGDTNTKNIENSKSFKCETCQSCYISKGNLTKHVATVHEKKKQFVCEICDYRCFKNSTMKKHEESVHDGKKLNTVIINTRQLVR